MMHGFPPLIGGLKDGEIIWNHIKKVDYDTLGYLLSCHLIIEHYLDHFLATYKNVPFGWKEARLSFAQKISLVSKLHCLTVYNFPPAIKHLNSLRNKFSHNINSTLTETDLLPFRKIVKDWMGNTDNPSDVKLLLSRFTAIVCAVIANLSTDEKK